MAISLVGAMAPSSLASLPVPKGSVPKGGGEDSRSQPKPGSHLVNDNKLSFQNETNQRLDMVLIRATYCKS